MQKSKFIIFCKEREAFVDKNSSYASFCVEQKSYSSNNKKLLARSLGEAFFCALDFGEVVVLVAGVLEYMVLDNALDTDTWRCTICNRDIHCTHIYILHHSCAWDIHSCTAFFMVVKVFPYV